MGRTERSAGWSERASGVRSSLPARRALASLLRSHSRRPQTRAKKRENNKQTNKTLAARTQTPQKKTGSKKLKFHTSKKTVCFFKRNFLM